MARTKISVDNRYSGLSILKALMSFEVIVAFLWDVNTKSTGALGWIYYLKGCAIPVFMMVAFIQAERQLKSGSGDGFWKKIGSLLVPLVGWAVIYWLFFSLLSGALTEEESTMYNITLKDLAFQIFTGNSPYLNPVMWLIVSEIVLLILFEIIILIAAKFHNVIFIVLMAGALVMQYVGITLNFGLRTEIMGVIKMLPEMLPLAVVGFMLAIYGTVEKTKKWWPVTMILSGGVICLLRYYEVFTDITGNGYAGIKRMVLATALVLLFAAPPLEKLPTSVRKVIDWLTKYSLGIFCMHRLVSTLLHYFISHRGWIDMETYTFFDCLITYIICYVLALLISLIPCKWTKLLVEG